ncbi:hypothetical protein [Nodosilinea nodulosa]|uniref:hypothetical protein n=1 Tax=Nodosilinea nodulosa TaxID=416001 RepID=UPI0002E39287|nr:hypothetical protein [Nodosilinea nodulosa]
MTSSKDYKRQIMNDLAGGNVESIDAKATQPEREYANFDDFANRSSREERRELGRGFHPDRIPPSQMEPELRQAIAKIKPKERDDVARDLLKHLKGRGLSDRDLEQQLGLSTHHASRMSEDDVTKLAAFTYHSHPDIFQDVLADQPGIMKFFSNPLVGAAVGAIAAKWLSKH